MLELPHEEYDTLDPWLAASGMQALALDPRRLRTALFQISPTRFGGAFEAELAASTKVSVWLHANVLERYRPMLSPAR